MFKITERFIKQCSLTLGQFDSESVNLLATLYHHQDACARLIRLSNDLKVKFENLLTIKNDVGEENSDTPLTRIELAIMIHFKQKYLSELGTDNHNNQSKSNIRFSVYEELNLAYCFLLAQIDDHLLEEIIEKLEFLFDIKQPVKSLFEIYEKLGENFPKFFSTLINCDYFAKRMARSAQIIQDFQLFIKRYEDFLITFEKYYTPILDNENNSMQTDAILNQDDAHEISSLIGFISSNRKQTKPPIAAPKVTVPHSPIQQSALSSSNVPQKGLCVIINIKEFNRSESIDPRRGSDKDVALIELVFTKLKFTVLKCNFDFTKDHFEQALDHINDKNTHGAHDCLVMFIMSHGFLHSFITADLKEVIIRDIINRFTDAPSTNIWTGKPRLFFIQACRSLWPSNIQCNNRERVTQNDLSPRMLVAYSCSPNETSKRSPKTGSNFIQILCIMLLRYSHHLNLENILQWTAKFVVKRDELVAHYKKVTVAMQRPEYIQREFSPNFRFCTQCLHDNSCSWTQDQRNFLGIPLSIWEEIYNFMFKSGANAVI